MRRHIRPAIAVLSVVVSGVFGEGCAKIPECTVSPVTIEETREDVTVLEKDLVTARDRAKELSQELAAKQAELGGKKDKPEQLRKKVKELKKGSGRDDEDKKDKDKDEDEDDKKDEDQEQE